MRLAGLTVVAVLAFPGAAFADAKIQATDGTLPDGSDNRWTPNAVTVKAGETVTVQPWFTPYTGRYVFHCHALEHGDKAMMLQLEVVR